MANTGMDRKNACHQQDALADPSFGSFQSSSPFRSVSVQQALRRVFDWYRNSQGYWDSQAFLQFVSDCPGLVSNTVESTVDVASLMECFFQEGATSNNCDTRNSTTRKQQLLLSMERFQHLIYRLAQFCYPSEIPSKSLWQFLVKHVFKLTPHVPGAKDSATCPDGRNGPPGEYPTSLLRNLEEYRERCKNLESELQARPEEEDQALETLHRHFSFLYSENVQEATLADAVQSLTYRDSCAIQSGGYRNGALYKLSTQLEAVSRIAEHAMPGKEDSHVKRTRKYMQQRQYEIVAQELYDMRSFCASVAKLATEEFKDFRRSLQAAMNRFYDAISVVQSNGGGKMLMVASRTRQTVVNMMDILETELDKGQRLLHYQDEALHSAESTLVDLMRRYNSIRLRTTKKRDEKLRQFQRTYKCKLERFQSSTVHLLRDLREIKLSTVDFKNDLSDMADWHRADFEKVRSTVTMLNSRLNETHNLRRKQLSKYQQLFELKNTQNRGLKRKLRDAAFELSSIKTSCNSLKDLLVNVEKLGEKCVASATAAVARKLSGSRQSELQHKRSIQIEVPPYRCFGENEDPVRERLQLLYEDIVSCYSKKSILSRRKQMEIEDLRSRLMRRILREWEVPPLVSSFGDLSASVGNHKEYEFTFNTAGRQIFRYPDPEREQSQSFFPASYSSAPIPSYRDQYLRWWDIVRHQLPPGLRRNIGDIGSLASVHNTDADGTQRS
eukprot:gb/GECG01012490.1/.p1 GENE.gb/GECG01012490.1/~~gb/GECG01012490.1/.p1  ORF type:complete len:726 (+),score=90.69 gb/GECG01012490.1/:1-2178(+)